MATGLSSRFTDLGRVGHKHKGFTQSGALDTNSHMLANAIMQVSITNPTIEVLLGGFEAVATQDTEIAVTGAQASVLIDDVRQPLNRKIVWKKDGTLRIIEPALGARNYIACNKRFKTRLFLDSCCAVTREKTGGMNFDGKGFQVADVLEYETGIHSAVSTNASINVRLSPIAPDSKGIAHKTLTTMAVPATTLAKVYVVRIVLGYQQALFEHKMKARFFNQRFTVSNEASNMGIRLSGGSIGEIAVKLYSEGIANGAIQITPDGLPIIMLAERQTIGGYPKIGSIITIDLPKLGQCRPGSIIQFEECDVLTARQEWLLGQIRMNNFAQNQLSRND
ncbi:biotin-dependent carboxyltransferase family protein [Brumicola pallidula]|nr:allophanate hydrolase subunit 2 family protein [Glaciecola pallidula]